MFKNQDLYQLLFNPDQDAPSGSFDHRTWNTYSGIESESTLVQLTSLHEGFHNELNNLTLYGSALQIFAHLAQYHKENKYHRVINGLVSRCKQAHEIYATFLSCSVISNGFDRSIDIEKNLLQNHQSYISYYRQGLHLVKSFNGSYLQELALGSIIISCFQDKDLIDSLLVDVRSFEINQIRNRHFPESRLRLIATEMPKDLLRNAFNTFAEAHKEHEGIAVFLKTEVNPFSYREAIADKFDNLQQLLNNHFITTLASWLEIYEYRTLPLSSNLPLLKDFYQQANDLLDSNVNLLVINDDAFNYERNVLLNFTAERYVVRKEPMEAHLYTLESFDESDWCKFSVGAGNDKHYFVVSRMPERIINQYNFNDEAKKWLTSHIGHPLVFLRRRVINESQNIKVVELFHIANTKVLEAFRKNIERPIVSNISMHTWAIEKWASEWIISLSDEITETILFDLPPHAQLENLFGENKLVRINKAWLRHKEYRHCALIIESQIDENFESPLFFMPASLVTCNVVSSYMLNNLGNSLVQENDEFMNRNSWLINIVMGHLFNETYYFDFNV